MLAYAAHIPHSPLLLPNIGNERSRLFKKVRSSIERIAEDLYARSIETVVTITPHGDGTDSAYIIHYAPRFEINFARFGDFTTHSYALGDAHTAYKLRHKLSSMHSVMSRTPRYLDPASSIASLHLRQSEKQLKIVPLTYQLENTERLRLFGATLRDIIEQCEQRIALISLGDLSRASKKTQKETKDFDSLLTNAIVSHDTDSFINDYGAQADTFHVSGYRPLAILLGALDGIAVETELVGYEQPLGIGMMVARFQF